MKIQSIINNRYALLMLIISLVISFNITHIILSEKKSKSETEVSKTTNECDMKTEVQKSVKSISIYSCITKCLFAFLLRGIVNDLKFIKTGLI